MSVNKNKMYLAGALFLSMLAGCGGGGADSNRAPQSLAAVGAVGVAVRAADYGQIVQQLYISYFGRPADPGGFNSFKNQLAAFGGPTDIQQLAQAYHDNAAIKALVDSFGTSAESATLYSGDNVAFVTAIYNNVLNRTPDSAGLAFWVGALNSGSLTRANASLAIMAGGLANKSAQGLSDAALINKKVTVGSNFTDALMRAPVNGYDGNVAAGKARAMLSSLTAGTDIQAFQGTITNLVSDLAAALPSSTSSTNVYAGFNYLQDLTSASSYSATYVDNGIGKAGTLRFGKSPITVSMTPMADGGIAYGAPVSYGVAINSNANNTHLPAVAMICKDMSGTGSKTSTDVLVSDAATRIGNAAELAGQSFLIYREDCSPGGGDARQTPGYAIRFDARGNATAIADGVTTNFSADDVTGALNGLSFALGDGHSVIFAYSYMREDQVKAYVIVQHGGNALSGLTRGFIGTWTQE